jgi:hypothetical protein
MKILYSCFISFAFFITTNSFGQKHEERWQDSIRHKFERITSEGFNASHPYYIAEGSVKDLTPAQVIRTLPADLNVIYISSPNQLELISRHSKLIPANDEWKLSPSLENKIRTTSNVQQKFILTGTGINELIQVLTPFEKDLEIITVDTPSHSIVVKAKRDFIHTVVQPLKQVLFIDIPATPHVESNIIGYDRSFHGINDVDYLMTGANGNQIVAGVKEQDVDPLDFDLQKRVLPSPLAYGNTSFHATVIASIIGGAGNSSYNGRGIAWGSNIFPSSYSNLFADDENILKSNKVSVQNHSYGTIVQQFYGAEAVSYDALVWENKYFLPVFSAGNDGEAAATEGQYKNIPGFANLTGNFKMAKNILTVAAADNQSGIPSKSSAGPTYDGRLAPQITALGPSGTSDAAAMVTGAIAVLQQVYADEHNGEMPPASLVKALLFTTAEDIHTAGIDYKTGYGLLNSYEAVKLLKEKHYDGSTIDNGQLWTSDINLPSNVAQFKLTLSWTDTTASANNIKAIVNDLDLEVVDHNTGTVYLPWVLSTVANKDSLSAPPIRKRDSLNTSEQVSIQLPAAPGTYQVRVKGRSVLSSHLPFNIAWKIDTLNSFMFTSPVHASDLHNRNTTTTPVKWKTFVRDSNEKADLYISYNKGTDYQLLQPSIRLTGKKYDWQVKDTTAPAVLKMHTAFGDFLSTPFMISKPTKVALEYNCTDSFRLLWNPNKLATSYRVYTLGDSPYLQPILTVQDSFVVMKHSQFPGQVYGVEPLLNNSLTDARSSSLNISQQGIDCFYRSFYSELLDGNQLKLVLQLSTAGYADSISFERLTQAGEVLKTYGAVLVSGNTLEFNTLVSDPPTGVSYWRARIKLKNGAIVYTNTIEALTSGEKNILFYPNPARSSTGISWVIRQGIPASSQLYLYDLTGRLLRKYTELPNKIEVSSLPAGVIIFKVFDTDTHTYATGKLVIF